jgi:hypothetical protein
MAQQRYSITDLFRRESSDLQISRDMITISRDVISKTGGVFRELHKLFNAVLVPGVGCSRIQLASAVQNADLAWSRGFFIYFMPRMMQKTMEIVWRYPDKAHMSLTMMVFRLSI